MEVHGIQRCCQIHPNLEVVRDTTWSRVAHWRLRVTRGPLKRASRIVHYTLSQPGHTRLSSAKDYGLTAGSKVSDTPSQRLFHSGSLTQAMYLVAFLAYALSGILPRKARESLVSSILPSFSCSWKSKGVTPTSHLSVFGIVIMNQCHPSLWCSHFCISFRLPVSLFPGHETNCILILWSHMSSSILTANQSSLHQD